MPATAITPIPVQTKMHDGTKIHADIKTNPQ
jgi:hypothetical protein